ncbi:hypothetical protein MASR1M8_15980 [Thermomonas brevis]
MTTLRVEIPAKLTPFLSPARYKVAHGGRGGGKSWAVARILLALGMSKPMRILCTREVQKSLKESVHRLLSDQIAAMGLERFYDVQLATIKGANGTEFLFAGLQDHTVDSIKSYEGVDIAWVEEAHSVSELSWQILTPTIRKPGSEIWATYNPTLEDDPVHQRFVVQGDPQAVVVQINWRDNPWFPAVLEAERDQMKSINEDLYRHVWEGECRSLAGMIFKRAWFKRFERAPKGLRTYIASDYAVTPDGGDWTEHGVFGLDSSGNLYVIDWWSGQADPETSISAWLRLVQLHRPRLSFDEAGVIHRALEGAINKRMRETGIFVARETLPSASSKADRALGFAARASAGAVYMPRTDWGERLINQLASFTGEEGRVDDMVDVCSLIGRGLDLMANGAATPPPPPPAPKPFTEAWWEARDRNRSDDTARDDRYLR